MAEQLLVKRIVLWMDGSLESGLQVRMFVNEEGQDSFENATGKLSANCELVDCLNRWQTAYKKLSQAVRLSVNKIIVEEIVDDKAEHCRELGAELEAKFREWLLHSPEFGNIEQKIREAVVRERDTIRIVINTEDKQLHRLPWHKWSFVNDHRFAEVCFGVSSRPEEPITLKRKGKVKILAIIGDDTNIDVEADKKLLKELPNTDVKILPQPTREVINRHLWNERYDILFFAGHSLSKKSSGVLHINSKDALLVDNLEYGLKRAIANGLQLAIFNSCDGLGLAYHLEKLGIPQVVVMREPVPDRVAHEFLKNFLDSMAREHQPFHLAIRTAREKLNGLEDNYPCAGWLPLTFQRPWDKPFEPYPLRPLGSPPKVRRTRKQLLFVLVASLVMTGLVMGSRWHGHLQSWELQAYDFLMRQRPIEKPDSRLLVVRATEEDLFRLNESTLSDQTVLEVLEKLKSYQPLAIGLDIARHKPQGNAHQALINHLKTEKNIFNICIWANPNNPSVSEIPPPPGIASNNVRFANVLLDQDGVTRRHLILSNPPNDSGCKATFSLSAELAMTYFEKENIEIHVDDKNHLAGLGKSTLQKITKDTLNKQSGFYQALRPNKDLSGEQILLNYRPFRKAEDIAPTVSFLQIKNGEKIDYEKFVKGKLVLIGYDNQKRDIDVHHTPYGKLSGVFLHAHQISHMLSAATGERPFIKWLPWWGDAFWIWLWAGIGGILSWWLRHLLVLCSLGGIALVVLYGFCLQFLIQGMALPIIPSMLALITTMASIMIFRILKTHQS
jgi:CHASE2 domain-containing sensor protein